MPYSSQYTSHCFTSGRTPGAPLRIAASLALMVAAVAGCDDPDDPDAPADLDQDSRFADAEASFDESRDGGDPADRFDARTEWGGPRLSPGDLPPFRNGEYDVISLSDTLLPADLARAHAAAHAIRGAVLFTVQEDGHLHFVAASPHDDAEESLPEQLMDVLVHAGGAGTSAGAVCNVLYRYPGWWGTQFTLCGVSGTGVDKYSNLASYGYDNLASSFAYDAVPVGVAELFNYTQFSGFLIDLDWDVWSFPSNWDNKTSSIRYYY